ncbi:MAG: glycosyltransferase family 39 protein [Deltaproteobacteria bacterium]|nr:glycosyltransferase family 39 protein [Deltaproteobacteria bacterium]
MSEAIAAAPERRWARPAAVAGAGDVVRFAAWPATVAIGGAVLALLLLFAGYGYNLEDEGTVLYQILRTHRGERPYLDFHTGYTPAVFYLNAWLFDVFGVSVLPIRVVLACVNAIAVMLTFRLALRVAPVAEAALAALTYAVFMPFFQGQFASFNIPYPAWYAVAAWLATQLASVKAVESASRVWLVVAGALAGLAFSFKPNTGVLALGAAVLAQMLASAQLRGTPGRVLEILVLAVAGVAVAATLTFDVITPQFVLLGGPLLVLLTGGIWMRVTHRPPGDERPFGAGLADAMALLAGFVAVTAAWLAYFLPRLGLGRFAEEVLLLGAGVERIYLLYFPRPSEWGVAVLCLLVLAVALPRLIARGVLGGRALAALGLVLVAGGAIALAQFGLAPEGLGVSIVMQLEVLSFHLIPLLLWAATLAVLWRTRSVERVPGGALPRQLAVAMVSLVYALLLFLQLYPRIDFMHVVISMPSALVVAAGGLARFAQWWVAELHGVAGWDAARSRRALVRIRAVVCLPIVLALGVRALPFLDARVRLTPDVALRGTTPLAHAAMPVVVEEDRDRDLRELRAVADFVEQNTRRDEPIFVFPALAMLPFLTDRTTPVPHDYFFTGRPSHADEAAMVAAIERTRPPLLVTLNDRLGYFSAAPAYYFVLRDHVQRSYALVRRIGRYDVLARRDVLEQHPEWRQPEISGAILDDTLAHGGYAHALAGARRIAERGTAQDLAGAAPRLSDVDRRVRQAYAAAIDAVAARESGGYAAIERAIATSRSARLLYLRTLGEYGSPASLGYLQDVFLGSDGRIRWEAARSINFLLARELSTRFNLVEPAQGPLVTLPDTLQSDALVAPIGDDFAERQRIGPLAALAVAHAKRDDLKAKIDGPWDRRETTWWKMLAAYALVQMGDEDRLATLFELMNEGTLPGQFVPSIVLDPRLVAPAAASALVVERLRSGSPEERETAVWMVPYLAEPGGAWRAVEAVTNDADPRVRHAAQWALEQRARASATRRARPEES